jgi:HTH-type transcriptional regulator/antitoxin HigA
MKLKIIKSKKDYLKSLERFEEIFQAEVGSEESDEADILALLITEYEDKNFITHSPSIIDAIK